MLAQLRKPILTWLIVAGLITSGVVLFTFTPASHTAVSQQAELFIQKEANPNTLSVGAELTYRLRIRNLGPSDATGVIVTDTLPANVNFVSTSSGCLHSARTVTCKIGNMRNGESAVRLIRVRPTAPGKISNTATVRANEADPKPANNTDTAVSNAQGTPGTLGSLPPDPGDAGKQTLAGIDSDGDGVRDDIQRYIALTYPNSAKTRAALTQLSKALQQSLLDATDKQASVTNAIDQSKAITCLSYIHGNENARIIFNEIRAQIINTHERLVALVTSDSKLGGQSFPAANPSDRKFTCVFDPDTMEN
jgi:uncharacterized repeat protein (TIGR01451 family)